jgi:hypothetical protein
LRCGGRGGFGIGDAVKRPSTAIQEFNTVYERERQSIETFQNDDVLNDVPASSVKLRE